MSRSPSLNRAVAQLDRHGSGTPNDVPPAPPTWAEGMAAFTAAVSVSGMQIGANIRAWQDSMRSKSETT